MGNRKSMDDSQTSQATLDPRADRTDEELLLSYRETGDQDQFAQLVQRYEKELYNYLRRYVADAAMAEDVFQATFLQLHLKCDMFEAGRKVRPWLYTIATNQAIDAQRRNKRHRLTSLDRQTTSAGESAGKLMDLLADEQPGPEEDLETGERRQWAREAVAALPEALRSSVILVYFQGMKYREAAEVLSIPVGTIKSRLHAAITKLNQIWLETHPPRSEEA